MAGNRKQTRQRLIEALHQFRRLLAESDTDASGGESPKEIPVGDLNEWAFNALSDPASIIDGDHRILRVNQAMARNLGIEPVEAVGLTCHQVMHNRDEPPDFCPLDKMLNDGREHQTEVAADCLGGTFLVTVSPIHKPDGSLAGCVHVARDITAQKRAEKAVAEKTMMLDSILRSANTIAIATTDLDFRITYYNPTAEEFFSYPAEEEIGRTVMEMHTRENLGLERFERAIEAVRRDGEYCYSLTQHLEDGGTRELDSRVSGIFDPEGTLVGYCLISQDVTEREQAGETLRESEKKYRLLAENTADFIFQMDLRMKFIYMSPSLFTVMGYHPEEVVGIRLFSYARRREFIKMARQAIGTLKNYKNNPVAFFETKLIHKDGTEIPVEVSGRILLNESGKPIGYQGNIREITERRKADEALRKSEEKYRNLIQHSDDAIYLLYNNRFEIINDRFQEIFGLTLRDVNQTDFDIMDLVAPRSRAVVKERADHLARGETLSPRYEFSALSRDGNEIEVEVSTSYINYRDGIATQGILRDIAENKQMELQLRQSQKMESVGTLAGGIAHDFNNLLTVINGHTELGLMNCGESHPGYPHMMAVLNAGENAANLTKQLLAFSRKQITDLRTIDINQLIHDLDRMMRRLIGEDFNMEMVLSNGIPLIKADTTQIEQIMVNLIVNARDARFSEKEAIAYTRHQTARLRLLWLETWIGRSTSWSPIWSCRK